MYKRQDIAVGEDDNGNNGGNQGPPRGPTNGPAYPRREQNKKLDVLNVKFDQYKEQNMRCENIINVKLDELTNSLCSIDAVSYTHLDVYKRQGVYCDSEYIHK